MILEKILKTKFYDFSKSVSGEINNDGTFTFRYNLIPLWRFNFVRVVYFKGQILEAKEGSKINARISPNIFLVLLLSFYSLPLLGLNIFFGNMNSLMGRCRDTRDSIILSS